MWDYKERRYLTSDEITEREIRRRQYQKFQEEAAKCNDLLPFKWSELFQALFIVAIGFAVAALVLPGRSDNSNPDDITMVSLKAEVQRAEAELRTAKQQLENLTKEKEFLESRCNFHENCKVVLKKEGLEKPKKKQVEY